MLGCGLVALGMSSFALGMSVALWMGHLGIRKGGGEMCGVGVSVSGYDLYVTGVLLTC